MSQPQSEFDVLSLLSIPSILDFGLNDAELGELSEFERTSSVNDVNLQNPSIAEDGGNAVSPIPAIVPIVSGTASVASSGRSSKNGVRAKYWCFTLNNYTPECVKRLERLDGNVRVSYLIAGREVGDSGTPHLQGFIAFTSRVRLSTVVSTVGRAHCSCARLIKHSIEYCKKDGDFFEIGTEPKKSDNQGTRTDLEEFKQAVIEGSVKNCIQAREQFSTVYAKYSRFVNEYLEDQKPKVDIQFYPLRIWQRDLNEKLNLPPDPRTITFVVDTVGNGGKSWFAHYVAHMRAEDSVQVLVPGKKADMNYALDTSARVLFIDAPRSKQGDFIQYDFLEEVKNGYIASYKYESRCKRMGPCHVIVLMNEYPDMTKLSADRYNIIELTPASLVCAAEAV